MVGRENVSKPWHKCQCRCSDFIFNSPNVNILSEMEIEKGRILMVKVKIDNQLFVFINIILQIKDQIEF